jgi:hypothetical protein
MDDAKKVLSNMVWKLEGALAKFPEEPNKKWQMLVLSKSEVEALLTIHHNLKGNSHV